MSLADNKMDFFEIGDHTSLICADPTVAETVRGTLRELGFKIHSVDNSEMAIERMRYTPYDIIVIQEDFAGHSLQSNPPLHYFAPLSMAQRRTSMVVLIGPSFKTLDAMQAFGQSVQLVVNPADLPNLTAIMKKSWAEFGMQYCVYKSVVATLNES